jgi:hypothetical protein
LLIAATALVAASIGFITRRYQKKSIGLLYGFPIRFVFLALG